MLLRILQGTALTLIAAVGFATIQEAYEENQAVKVMALMANISLLAPLAGPVLGAIMIEYVSWHWGFMKTLYLHLGFTGLVAICALSVLAYTWFAIPVIKSVMAERENHGLLQG